MTDPDDRQVAFENPYASPTVDVSSVPSTGAVPSDAERIRREHISHEASVKSIGLLQYVGGALMSLSGIAGLLLFAANPRADAVGAIFGPIYIVLGILSFVLGYNLRKLRGWARWTTVVVTSIGILFMLSGLAVAILDLVRANVSLVGLTVPVAAFLLIALIPFCVVGLLVARKSRVIFSESYRQVIEQTPHIKYGMSFVLGVVLFVFVSLLGLFWIGRNLVL